MKILLTAVTLTLVPGLAMAQCNWMKSTDTAASCAEGFAWDAEARACVAVTTS